jgi:hypothetical protein
MPRSASATEILGWKRGRIARPAQDAVIPDLFDEAQLQGFARTVTLGIQEMTEDQAIDSLVETTVNGLQAVAQREATRAGGISPIPRLVIDGKAGATLDAIRPDSLIVILWNYLPEAAQRTYDALVQRSPRLSGEYIAGLHMFVDGARAGSDAITFDTAEVRIVATVPYARRLEVGMTKSHQPYVKRVAPHIVEETAIYAREKFRDIATVTYELIDMPGSYRLRMPISRRARHWRGGRWVRDATSRMRGGSPETNVLYPSILMAPKI